MGAKRGKVFFFERKKQKTFDSFGFGVARGSVKAPRFFVF
jgi:hypothetical protein